MEVLLQLKKHLTSLYQNFYWTIPFIAFYIGYWVPNTFFRTTSLETPALVGKSVEEALVLLSQVQLNVRLIAQKEDPTLPAGTIITQIPAPYQLTKTHQSVFVTVSKKPDTTASPDCIGKQYETFKPHIAEKRIRHKRFYLESHQPDDLCLAQYPASGIPLDDTLIIYQSRNLFQTVLMPNFEDQPIEDVLEFLQSYAISPKIFHTKNISESHICKHCKVKEQKPLPGSLINLKQPLSLQLKVS